MLLEGLTLGSIFCGLVTQYAQRGIDLSGREVIDALGASELPKNHHVSRAVRRSFLRASVHQLLRFEKAAEARANYDDVEGAFIARRRLQWSSLKSQWIVVPLPGGRSQMALIDAALDEIRGGSPSAKQNALELKQHLLKLAIEEILNEASWPSCPKLFVSQMSAEDDGWFASFSAHMAKELKYNTELSRIQSAISIRSVGEKVDVASAFQMSADKRLSDKLAAIQTSIADGSLAASLTDRALNQISLKTDDILAELRNAPFGRRYQATQTSEMVGLRIKQLTRFFAGRDHALRTIDELINSSLSGTRPGLIIITAPAGFGKSALAAAWCEYAKTFPDRHIALHFCSAAQFAAETTQPTKVLEHLWAQVAAIYDEAVDLTSPEDALVATLQKRPPDQRNLVLWLDGLDEAQAEIRPFLPIANKLARGIVLVISARAEPESTPRYLAPWVELGEPPNAWVDSYKHASRYHLEKLTRSDVAEFCDGLFETRGLTPPSTLADEVYHASDEGYAIFVRYMAEDALAAIEDGRNFDLGNTPLSLTNYARTELVRLQSVPAWNKFEHVFDILTVVRGSIDLISLRELFPGSPRLNAHALPPELSRWLVFSPPSVQEATVGFAHPKLSSIFQEAIREQGDGRIQTALRTLATYRPSPQTMSKSLLSNLPLYCLQAGRADRVLALLDDPHFVDERFSRLGAGTAAGLMAEDWKELFASSVELLDDADKERTAIQTAFWMRYADVIQREERLGWSSTRLQLMSDTDVREHSSTPRLVRSMRSLLLPDGALDSRHSVSNLTKHRKSEGEQQLGAIEIRDERIVSWGSLGGLRWWSPEGKCVRTITGHTGWISGVLQTGSDRLLSWGSADNALKLWDCDGVEISKLVGHGSHVIGAFETWQKRLISWAADGTLRIWDEDGSPLAIARGHKGPILKVLSLSGDRLLACGSDGMLSLWSSEGTERGRLTGHLGPVFGALETRSGRIISWSSDGSLRLWSSAGAELAVLRGHTGPVFGAIETPKGNLVSWGSDRQPRLWSQDGSFLRGLGQPADGIRASMTSSGRILTWGSDSGLLRIWTEDGTFLADSPFHAGQVWSVNEMRDGKLLSWGADGAVVQSDADGRVDQRWVVPNLESIRSVCIAGRDRIIVTAGSQLFVVQFREGLGNV